MTKHRDSQVDEGKGAAQLDAACPVDMQYRTLRCDLTHCSPESAAFRDVEQVVLAKQEANKRVQVLNVFVVNRPAERALFERLGFRLSCQPVLN